VNGNHLGDGDLLFSHLVEDLSLGQVDQFTGLFQVGRKAVEANFTFFLVNCGVSELALVHWVHAEADLALSFDFHLLNNGLFLQSLGVFTLEQGVHGLVSISVLVLVIVLVLVLVLVLVFVALLVLVTEWVLAISLVLLSVLHLVFVVFVSERVLSIGLVFLSVLSEVVLSEHLSIELVMVVGSVDLFVFVEATSGVFVHLGPVFAVVSEEVILLLVNVLAALVVLGEVLLERVVHIALVLPLLQADGLAFVLLDLLAMLAFDHVGFNEGLRVGLDALVWSHELRLLVLDHLSANSANASLPHVRDFNLDVLSVGDDLEAMVWGLQDDLSSVKLDKSDGLSELFGLDDVHLIDFEGLFLSIDDHVGGRSADVTGQDDEVVQEANFNILVAFASWAGVDGEELLCGAVLGKNVFAWGKFSLHDVLVEALDSVSVNVATGGNVSLGEADESLLEVGGAGGDWESESGKKFRVDVSVQDLLNGLNKVDVET